VAEQYREREDKYDVDAAWVMPGLMPALPSGARVEEVTLRLSSVYFDTDDFALLRNKVTLRRRSGDADVGWQLKLPDGKARTELRLAPTTGRAVPRELQDLLLGVRTGDTLKPIAKIDTRREAWRILAADGTLLAEIADDHVDAATMGEATVVSQWREVEVELGSGDEALLGAVGQLITDAGATPALGPSKLARLLSHPTPKDQARARRRTPEVTHPITDYLQAQYAALITGDLALRRGHDVIHATRVATRRYRSVLHVFADLFDADRADALDIELAWYANLLGQVRDLQVLREHLDRIVHTLPPELVLGPVSARIDEHLVSQTLKAREQLTREMRSKRYVALLAELKLWYQQPPLTSGANQPPTDVATFLNRAQRTLAKRLRQAARPGASDERLHRARKASKRSRYTAELATPVLGKKAKRIVKRSTELQDILGKHQDSIVAGEVLLRLGATAGTRPGENGFTFGLLHAHEQHRADASRARALKRARHG
jgi:CHAD domain-containing protein